MRHRFEINLTLLQFHYAELFVKLQLLKQFQIKFRCSLAYIILISFTNSNYGQHYQMHPDIKIDTSYSVNSAYQKIIKKYPEISVARYSSKYQIQVYRNLIYQNYDKRAMHLDIFIPGIQNSKPRPCVLLIHGGGWNSGDKSMLEPYAFALADYGFIAITVEYRFSDEENYPASVMDIKNATKWVHLNAKKYGIESTKISILGCSAGGQLASLVGVTSHLDIFKDPTADSKHYPKINAIINIDGIISFIHPLSEEGKDQNKKGAAEKWFGVHYTVDSAKWIEASPLTYVGANSPPVLFIASSFSRFNAGRENMIVILNKYNVYNEKHIFNHAPHTFWLFNPWFKPTLSILTEFLSKINQ